MVDRHGFWTAHAVHAWALGLVSVGREAVALAMVSESVEQGLCTESPEAQEEPHQMRKMKERR